MREVVLHGGLDESFDRSVGFARRLAESFGARLHVLYTVEEPLSAGWTSEVGAERMPEVHQAMEAEARERLARFIPAEEQEHVFERFFRTTRATEQAIQGTGLGLAICKAIVHAHGGQITLASSDGAGATFRVAIPIRAVQPGAPAQEEMAS